MRIHKESIDRFFDYDFHMETRTIYLGSDVDDEGNDKGVTALTSERALKALHLLVAANAEAPIKIILNSVGGDWYHGMAIYDAIKACPCHVTIEVSGQAMSMGSIILQAADERLLHKNSTVMIHDGHESIQGTPKTAEAWAKQSKLTREVMYEIYAERSKKPEGFWEKKCGSDFVLTAEQAVEFGLADKIIDAEEEEET